MTSAEQQFVTNIVKSVNDNLAKVLVELHSVREVLDRIAQSNDNVVGKMDKRRGRSGFRD
jgi:hypothetical protein